MERWESAVSQYEEKSKKKMNNEIKWAGPEALVPKELEKHLILNSNRLRTVEDARRAVVTYVEKQFDFEIRDYKPSDTDCVSTQRLERSTLSRQSKEKGHQVRAMGVLSAMEHIFNEIATQARKLASKRQAKEIKAKSKVSPQSPKAELSNGKYKVKSKGTKRSLRQR